jgi:hypothetical protein
MGIVRTGETPLDRELQKFEQFPTNINGRFVPAGNPYVFREFPLMRYMAFKRPNGQYACMDHSRIDPWSFGKNDAGYLAALAEQESFNASCQRVVQNQQECDRAADQGWCATPQEALAFQEQREQAMADEAAAVAYQAQRMSSKAQAELAAADAQTEAHVVDVVSPPARSTHRTRARGVAPMATTETE